MDESKIRKMARALVREYTDPRTGEVNLTGICEHIADDLDLDASDEDLAYLVFEAAATVKANR